MKCMPISILIQALVVLAHKPLELVVLDHMKLDHMKLDHMGLDHMGLEVVDMVRGAMVPTLVQVCCFLCSLLETESTISAGASSLLVISAC